MDYNSSGTLRVMRYSINVLKFSLKSTFSLLYPNFALYLRISGAYLYIFRSSAMSFVSVSAEMTVGKDQEVTVKSKGAGGQGKVGAKVTGPSGKPVASKV